MKQVTLHENNAGGLYLHITGDSIVYGQIEQASEAGAFVADCKSLLAGEGSDWEVETYPLSEIDDVPEVASYDGSVSITSDPGLAARVYLGMGRDAAAIDWTDLLVSDSDGATGETLGSMVEAAPANLDTAVLDSTGRISEWPDYLLSAEGEDADWDTPRVAVNWDGLREKLGR